MPTVELVLEKIGLESATIKSIKPHPKRSQYRAVVNWLTEYQPHANSSNLEKVKGFLEAFYHLCEVEDSDRASQLIFIRLNTPTKEEFHKQLYTWGYYQTQIEIYIQLLSFSELIPQTKATILTNLGKANIALVNFDKAIEYLKKSLSIAQEIESREEEEQAIENLGYVYLFQRKYPQAGKQFRQSLEISLEIKDRQKEGSVLGEIGNFYAHRKKYERAIDYYLQQLAIGQEIQSPSLEATAKCNLGIVYCIALLESGIGNRE